MAELHQFLCTLPVAVARFSSEKSLVDGVISWGQWARIKHDLCLEGVCQLDVKTTTVFVLVHQNAAQGPKSALYV